MKTMNNIVVLLLLVCYPLTAFLMPSDESLNEIEDSYDDQDASNDNETEIVTKLPPPKIRVPPAHASLKGDKKSEKARVFEKNQNYNAAQIEIWPKKGFSDIHDVSDIAAYCHATEVDVFLSFSYPFHGYIYPFHHFRRCHLFIGDGQSDVNLLITEDSCGLDVKYFSDNGTLQFMEITFLIQWNKQYITQWDRKLRITCNRAETHRDAVILSNSSDHALSSVVSMRVENEDGGEVEDDGDNVAATRNYDPVQVGEEVTVAFNVHLPANGPLDANVVKCIAHDGLRGLNDQKSVLHTYNAKEEKETSWNGVITLLSSGCSKDEGRFSNFDKENINGVLELSNTFQIFRFPTSHFLFLECQVQICMGQCPSPPDCDSKLKTDVPDSNDIKTVKLFRPLMVKLGSLIGVSPMDEGFGMNERNEKEVAPNRGVPTASFIAGLVGMGFICAIICVFMYRRFKKGTEKDYKMEYSPNSHVVNNVEEVAPLKVTPAESAE